LLIPQLPDHTGHSARVLAAGAGAVLTRDQASEDVVVEQARRLLACGAPARDGVRALAEEMHRCPTPSQVAGELVALVEGS
jgi:UDP:flavonoid glycosyltransferase YjiC (YdhE family)